MIDHETDSQASHNSPQWVIHHDTNNLLHQLQARANKLLSELKDYQTCLAAHGKSKDVEIRFFRRGVDSEAKSIERIVQASKSNPKDASDKNDRGIAGETPAQNNDKCQVTVVTVEQDDPVDEQGKAHATDEDGDSEHHDTEEQESKNFHIIRSSNLPFYEAVWKTAKSCHGITALGKRMYWSSTSQPTLHPDEADVVSDDRKSRTRSKQPPKKSVLVDVVADNGKQWVKISTITEKRLLFEMAKEGWAGFDDDEESDEGEDEVRPISEMKEVDRNDGEYSNSDQGMKFVLPQRLSVRDSSIELIKLAKDLKDAALATRVDYQHPQVCFILPRINEGSIPEIDAVLESVRSTGATVYCGISTGLDRPDNNDGPSPETLSDQPPCHGEGNEPEANGIGTTLHDFTHLLPSIHTADLTSTLNIDCTILLALISDISHRKNSELVPHHKTLNETDPKTRIDRFIPKKSLHAAILRQIRCEETEPLLPTELYPILNGRDLVCTHLAAKRMREIVQMMGTIEERVRAEIFLGEGVFANHTQTDLSEELRKVSCHDVPTDLKLPIKVLVEDGDLREFTLGLSGDVTSANKPDRPISNLTDQTSTSNSTKHPISDPQPPIPTPSHTTIIPTPKPTISPSTTPQMQMQTQTQSQIKNYRPKLYPKIQSILSQTLSPINHSVFLTGWTLNTTTITSNRAVVLELEKKINTILDDFEFHTNSNIGGDDAQEDKIEVAAFRGPKIYLSNTARSLIGKEKPGGSGKVRSG